MQIDVLYFDGCPNHEPALEQVRDTIATAAIDAVLNEIEIKNLEDVERLAFLGSPTIRINGIDIEPERRDDTNYAMSCRRYGDSGVPSRDLLLRAFSELGSK
ncbi:hypothetical protein DRQ32_11295 [bacterium]|nr:MAG: hypothetical protein DRQ32_11295 [bacterium]